jgi:hypothetical protein
MSHSKDARPLCGSKKDFGKVRDQGLSGSEDVTGWTIWGSIFGKKKF